MARMLLAVVLAGTTGCLDSSGPSAGTPPTLPGLVVSAPVQSSALQGSGAASAASTGSADVAYVSLAPGSVSDARQATIRNRATGQAVSGIVVNGGFDPVALVANVGDTLLVAITRAGFTEPLRAAEVVRRGRRPVVVRTSPPRGGRDVPLNANIVIVFSTPISTTTLTTASVTLWHGTTPLAGTVRFADDADLRAEFHADTLLTPETQYQLVVTTAILDVNGLALDSNVTVPFTTGTIAPATNLVFASVSGGYNHTCGLTTAGAAFCWGENPGGLGDGTTTSSTTPVAVAGSLTFAAVSAGTYHTCGVTPSGAAYCWGTGGIGNPAGYSPTPVPVAGGLTFAAVSAGAYHSCGVTTTGAAYCWGDGFYGQRGDGDTATVYPQTPVPVAGGLTFAAVSAGGNASCGVTTTGVAYCWGMNAHGQLGVGTSTGPERCQNPGTAPYSYACSTVPVAVAGGLTFKGVIAGYGVTCGVTTSGAPYCWGENLYGALGNGTNTGPEQCEDPDDPWNPGPYVTPCSSVPVAVAGELTLASLNTGGPFYVCGLTPAGTTYCWGTSPNGDVTPTPDAVAGGLTFATIDNGVTATCGVTTAGVAYCWGANDHGQLGDGTTTDSKVPVKVAGQP